MNKCPNQAQRLKEAEILCKENGVRFTQQRRRVMQILCQTNRPMGAYDILEQMREELPRVAPPTVYRALDFLLEQGLIHKLETLHAYVGCEHPSIKSHSGQFLICSSCGHVTELEDAKISDSLGQAAEATGFNPSHPVVEVTGLCADCAN